MDDLIGSVVFLAWIGFIVAVWLVLLRQHRKPVCARRVTTASPRTDYDKFRVSNSSGVKLEVFEPRWYELRRWLRWWLRPRATRCTVTFTTGRGAVTVRAHSTED